MTRTMIPFGTRGGFLSDLRQEMDDLFNRFLSEDNGNEGRMLAAWSPRLDLSETESQYKVSVELPGMKPEDVDVEIRQGDLWITGERKSESEEEGKTWHRIERSYGQFRRVLRLGNDVDPDKVEAEYKDGLLHITVGKTEEAKSKKITVKC